MNSNASTSIAAGVAQALGISLDQPTYKPAEAVRLITRDPRSGNQPNHVERDTKTLRALGIEPQKIAGRWIVTAGQIAAFLAAGTAPTPRRIDLRTREHRHLRKTKAQATAAAASAMEVRHGR